MEIKNYPFKSTFILFFSLFFIFIVLNKSKAETSHSLNEAERYSLSPNARFEDILNYLKTSREVVNYSNIWYQHIPVLFIGEHHKNLFHKNEIIKQIPKLRKIGLSHIALEPLLEKHQLIINEYYNRTVSRERVLNIFQERFNYGAGIPEKYLEIVDTAIKHGLKVLAIDIDIHASEYFNHAFFVTRNYNWAKIIKKTLKDSPEFNYKPRVLVYCGSLNLGYDLTTLNTNEILFHKGTRSLVIKFIGGEKPHYFSDSLGDKIAIAARKLGIADTKFGIFITPTTLTRPADYFIHIPETKN